MDKSFKNFKEQMEDDSHSPSPPPTKKKTKTKPIQIYQSEIVDA